MCDTAGRAHLPGLPQGHHLDNGYESDPHCRKSGYTHLSMLVLLNALVALHAFETWPYFDFAFVSMRPISACWAAVLHAVVALSGGCPGQALRKGPS
jgi:hypothetical protein